jgi:hypothetical protein
MTKLKGLASIVLELRAERTDLVNQLRHVDAALSVLGKLNDGSSYTSPRRLSAAGRRKISLAQKARWGKQAAKGKRAAAGPKRKLSLAARKRIAAAQRARWARFRAEKKR